MWRLLKGMLYESIKQAVMKCEENFLAIEKIEYFNTKLECWRILYAGS